MTGEFVPEADMSRGWQSEGVHRRKAFGGKSGAPERATSVTNIRQNLGGHKFETPSHIKHLRESYRLYTAESLRPRAA